MKTPPKTLEESRQVRLRSGRRSDLGGRVLSTIGIGLAALVIAVVANAVCGRVVPLGKADLAAGNPSRVFLTPWKNAKEVFRRTLPGGATVQARQTALGDGVPSAVEFRVDGRPAGTVFGDLGRPVDLGDCRVTLDTTNEVTIHLGPGYRPAHNEARAGRWKVRYITAR